MNASTSLINLYPASTKFQDATCGICLLLLDFFECTLKDILTAKNSHDHTKEKRILDSPPPNTTCNTTGETN